MVVVLRVAGVLALLRLRPATYLLQAARRVPTLDQAQGLGGQRAECRSEPTDCSRHPALCSQQQGTRRPAGRQGLPQGHRCPGSGCHWHTAPFRFRERSCAKPCAGAPVC